MNQMIVNVECPRCDGFGHVQAGADQVCCPRCQGFGSIEVDVEEEIEDWMRDE